MTELTDYIEKLKAELPEYTDWCVKNGEICVITKFIYTTAILSGVNDWGYEGRWCFHNYTDAKAALDEWKDEKEPTGWHRHPDTGRRVYEDHCEIRF